MEIFDAIAKVLLALKAVGAGPLFVMFFFLVVVPTVGGGYTLYKLVNALVERTPEKELATALGALKDEIKAREVADNKRFESVLQMYENNVILVKHYEKLSDDLSSVISVSTTALTRVVEKVDNNHFCPVIRKETGNG